MSSRAQQKARAREARLAAERAEAAKATRRRHLTLFAAILALAGVILAAAILVSRSGSAPEVAGERMELYAGIPQDGARLGRPDAPVVVQEFADLQCPFCAQASMDALPPVVRDYVRPGDVQLDMELLTFLGPDSVEAARLAAAAGLQDRQWQVVDAFYERQGAENSGYVTEQFLRDVAQAAPGLDVDRAFADRGDPQVAEQLAAARQDARRLGVDSTPTFLVGPRGGEQEAVTAEELPAAIERALDAART